jgi:hypothetical protein
MTKLLNTIRKDKEKHSAISTEPVTISVLFSGSCKIKGERKKVLENKEKEGSSSSSSSSSTVPIERGGLDPLMLYLQLPL